MTVIDEEEDTGADVGTDEYEPIPSAPAVVASEQLLPPAQVAPPDPGPLPGAPLLPPPQVPSPLKPHANAMALNWDGWFTTLTPDQQSAVKLATGEDPAGRIPVINKRWIAEKAQRTNQAVADNYETARAGYAIQNGWGAAAATDDGKFFAKVKERAALEKSDDIAVHGIRTNGLRGQAQGEMQQQGPTGSFVHKSFDTQEIRDSRENSMVNRAYWSAAEESSPGVKGMAGAALGSLPDLVSNFQKFEKDNKGKVIPEQLPQRYELFSRLYQAGMEDRAKANAVAAEAFPVLARGGDTGGPDIRTVLPLFSPLTSAQRALAVEKLKDMAGKGGQAGVESQNAGEQAVTTAGRAQANILEDAFHEFERDVNTRAFAAGGYDYKPSQAMENLYKELRGYSQNTLNATRRDTIPEILVQTFAESAPIMALTATPVGAPVRFMAYKNNARSDLMAQGYDEEAASAMAPFIAAGMTGADQLTFGALTKNPLMKEFIEKYTTMAFTRGASRLMGHTVSATAAVEVRNFMVQGWVKDFAHVMDHYIPGENWQAVGKQMADSLPETMVNMMALSAFGVGMAHYKDFNGVGIDRMARDAQALKALGFRDEQISAVVAASKGGAGEAFKEEFKRRSPVGEGDRVTLTPAQAADYAEKAAKAMGAALPKREADPEIAAALKEAFPEATEEGIQDEVTPETEDVANKDAGLESMFRDTNGWHLEDEGGKIIDSGNVETALDMRDQLTKEKQAEENADFAEKLGEAEKAKEEAGAEKPPEETQPVENEGESAVSEIDHPGREVPEIGLAKPEAKAEVAPTEAPQLSPESAGDSLSRSTSPNREPGSEGAPATSESGNRGNTTHAELEKLAKEFGITIPKEGKWTVPEEMAKAKEIVDKDPRAGERLVDELKKKPRPIDKTERFIINHEVERRARELREATKQNNAEGLTAAEKDIAQVRFDLADDAFQEALEQAHRSGSLAGSSLGAMRFAQNYDFSLEGMRAYVRAKYNKGEKFSASKKGKEMEAEVTRLHGDIAKMAEKLAALEKERAEAKTKKEVGVQDQAASEVAKEDATAIRGKRIAQGKRPTKAYFKKLQEDGLKQFRDALKGEVGAGFSWANPDAVAGAVKVVAGLIGEGITKVADLAKALAEKLGVEFGERDVERLREMSQADEFGPYFHGTNAEFDKFEHGHVNTTAFQASGVHWFSSSESAAGTYGKNIRRAFLKAKNPFVFNKRVEVEKMGIPDPHNKWDTRPQRYALSVEGIPQPEWLNEKHYLSKNDAQKAADEANKNIRVTEWEMAEAVRFAKENGHDAILFKNIDDAQGASHPGDVFGVFDSSQIREEIATPESSLIEKSKALKEDAFQKLKDLGATGKGGRLGLGPEKIAEAMYHAARFAVGAAGEYGIKGAELAAHLIEKLGDFAKEHIKTIMDLSESLRSEDLVKSVGDKVAKEEEAQRIEDRKNVQAEKKAQRDKEKANIAAIKDAGKRAAMEEDFERNVQKEADLAEKEDREEAERAGKFKKDLEDRAAKIASDDLIEEVGSDVAKPDDFASRVEAEGGKRDRDLENYRKAVEKRAAEIRERIKKEDFETRKKSPYVDKEKAAMLADYNGAVLEYERAKKKWEMENRTGQQKFFDAVADWKRTAVLASLPVIGKLTAAALEMIVITPGENLVGGALGKLPGISKVAAKAPRHGRFSFSAEAHAIAETWSNFFKDIKDVYRVGKTDYELLYENGEKIRVGAGLGEYLGRLHALLKSPAKRNEFARSFAYRTEFHSRNGISDEVMRTPDWQMRIGIEALKDAKHQLFLDDTAFTKGWTKFWGGIERWAQQREKEGDPVDAALLRTAKMLASWELPIVKIPTNIVKRIMEYAFGSIPGMARLGVALIKGVQDLKPEQADLIMRNLKRGSVGVAFALIGYFNPGIAGGYYQRGRYPGEDEPDFGELEINGVKVPKWAVHNPLLEMLQFGATIRKVSDEPLRKHAAETKGDLSGIKSAILGLSEEVPFINEIKHIADTVLDPNDKRSFLGEMFKSAIPAIIQQAARWTDPRAGEKDRKGKPVTRKPEGFIETIETGVPGLRNTVPTAEERKRTQHK